MSVGQTKSPAAWADAGIPDRYQELATDARLGDGKYGVVTKAWDCETETYVAVKKSPSYAVEALRNEFSVVSQLDHPNIVRPLHFGAAKDEAYLFMDRVEGSAADALPRRHALSLRRAPWQPRPMLQSMMQTLAYLHRKGFVHRDPHPQNWLCQGDRAVLIDFGLAQAVDPDTKEPFKSDLSLLILSANLLSDRAKSARLAKEFEAFTRRPLWEAWTLGQVPSEEQLANDPMFQPLPKPAASKFNCLGKLFQATLGLSR